MNKKELTETSMMISNWKKPFDCDVFYKLIQRFNPLTAKLSNLNFHPLEVVSRWRDPQLQVSENNSNLTKWRSKVFKYSWLMSHFILSFLERDVAQWLERGALPMSLPAVRFRIPLGPGFSKKNHVSPLSLSGHYFDVASFGKTLYPRMLHLTQV